MKSEIFYFIQELRFCFIEIDVKKVCTSTWGLNGVMIGVGDGGVGGGGVGGVVVVVGGGVGGGVGGVGGKLIIRLTPFNCYCNCLLELSLAKISP